MKRLILLTIIALCTQAFASETLHFVHLKAKNVQERSEIANHIHIDQIIENDVYATVNEHDLAALKKFQKNKIVTSHALLSMRDVKKTLSDEYEFPKNDERYHTYKEIIAVLDDLKARFPDIIELSSVGLTVEGRDIPMIRITHAKNRSSEYFVPGILFVGSHHAREHLSTEIPLLLAKHLAENYKTNTNIQRLVNSRDIYIIPALNVDGKLYDIKGRKYKRWRKNRSLNDGSSAIGVDLNRNYDYQWGTGGSSKSMYSNVYMGPAPFSEPETTAIKSLIENKPNIRILLSYHTYSELILYPWGGSYDHVGGVDQQIFEKMAQDMSKWNNYTPQKASDMYIASGDTCDWAYGVHNVYCFTFELTPKGFWGSGGFYPGAGVIDKTFLDNLNPAIYLMEYSDEPSRVLEKTLPNNS